MKNLNNYILEKFRFGKNNMAEHDNEFNSHITNNPHEFSNSNFIVNSQRFKKSYILNLMEYAKEIIDNKLVNDEDLTFVEYWYSRAKFAYKNTYITMYGGNSQMDEYLWLCNGDKPYFGNAKFTYDLLKYAERKPDLTIPRKKKINKMLRDYWDVVEKYASEMNWY